MKRKVALLLALATLVSLAGCVKTQQPETTTQEPTKTVTTIQRHDAADVGISEVMPDNKFLTMGHEHDWVELDNQEETEISLEGYYLTDDPEKPTQLSLEGLSIPAGGYLAIVLDDTAPFRLSADGETVYLFYYDQLLGQVTYGISENGESYDTEGPCPLATPGYANTQEGYMEYLQNLQLPELYISEVMSSNSTYLPVKDECYDLVEVKNGSNSPINLGDYTLTDKRSEPMRYQFPNVTLQPGEYYVVYCSGNVALGEDHTSFKISASGENLYLAKNGQITDALVIPGDVQKDQSFGRDGSVPSYFVVPTPGADNATGYLVTLAAPQSNLESGIYSEAVTVTLSASGTIYYTLDGSRPTTNSQIYTDPIIIDGIATIRTFCTDGEQTSELVSYTYLVGVEHDLPVVHVSIPQDSLTGYCGVLNHVGSNYEYEGVITLIEDGEEKFSVPVGFRLHGNDSRHGAKQNFQLRFRSEYGASKLEYPLFENRDIQEYDSLLLKGGSEDYRYCMMRDELLTGIAGTNTYLYTQAMKPVVLYLGGQYWGVYYMRERFSDDYVASHMNVSEESVDILKYADATVQCGDSKDFHALRKFTRENDMSKQENYDYLASQICVESLVDWYICRTYAADRDVGNIRRCRSSESDGKWYWMYFDLDWGFFRKEGAPVTYILSHGNGDIELIHAVLSSEAGRDLYLTRWAELLETNLNETYILGYIDNLVAQIESEMPRDRARWGKTMDQWNYYVDYIRGIVKDNARTKTILWDLQNYFNLSDAEMEHYFSKVME